MQESPGVTIDDVRAAARRLAGHAHRTPIIRCETLDRLAGRKLFLKCENLQKVGAFKFRGAWNAVALLSEEAATRGVVTHSSGNHAQALALAARLRGITARIVMPTNAPLVKRRAVEEYGALVVPCEPTLEAREAGAVAVMAQTGASFIHPYDDPQVIAGQGTAALELFEDVPSLDAVIAPVGGGGLLAGTAIATHGVSSNARVFAAEPSGADDAARSKAAGRLIPQTAPKTIADGLLTSLGVHTWPLLRDRVERVITVDDEAIVRAMRSLFERAKLVVEPSGAVALAAVLSDEFRALSGMTQVGVILSGGNVDLDQLPW